MQAIPQIITRVISQEVWETIKKNVAYLPKLFNLIKGLNINFYIKFSADLLTRKMQMSHEILKVKT